MEIKRKTVNGERNRRIEKERVIFHNISVQHLHYTPKFPVEGIHNFKGIFTLPVTDKQYLRMETEKKHSNHICSL